MSGPARVMIVVSGLAASGKRTVGRALSEGLSLPVIDKDDILEALFDSMGCENREQRHRLSRDVRAALALALQPTPMTEEPPLETDNMRFP